LGEQAREPDRVCLDGRRAPALWIGLKPLYSYRLNKLAWSYRHIFFLHFFYFLSVAMQFRRGQTEFGISQFSSIFSILLMTSDKYMYR
jgi:hypothetical protein